MDISNFSKSKNQRFIEFYEKTGIQLTDEPLSMYPAEIQDEMDELYHLFQVYPHKAIPRLERLLTKYPHVPAIQNFLHSSYLKTKNIQKAEAIQERTLREHPDYLFGIVSKILSLTLKEDMDKYIQLLGGPRDIRSFMPGEKVYHLAAFAAYEAALAHYEAFTGNQQSAVRRLETLIELDVEPAKLDDVARHIALGRIANMIIRSNEEKKYARSVESAAKVDFEPTEAPPVLECQELEILYTHSLDTLDTDVIARLSQLPREALVRDLERMLGDSIRRREYFMRDEYDEVTWSFPLHALYFLGALKAEGSLQKVLDLLRMGKGFTNEWFGEGVDQDIFTTLYALGENQLEELKNFVLEQDLDAFDRLHAPRMVAQVALHQPNRRAEVVKWFGDVFDHLLEHLDDDRLIDTNFIGHSVAEVIQFRGLELLPLIEKMWAKNLIPPSICGKLEAITEDLNEPPHESDIKPLPKNIQEYYTGEYRLQKAPLPEKQLAILAGLKDFMENKAEKLVVKYWAKMLGLPLMDKNQYHEGPPHPHDADDSTDSPSELYPLPKQVKREAPKVGRNDPCPCGSGKKYKKCCMNK